MTDPVHAAPDDSTLVRIRGLTTVLNGKTIFDALEMDIPRGKITAIMGPSGTGKTTLLKHITGQMRADAGSIEVDGRHVAELSREQLYKLREGIGYLFQNSALLTDFNVFENVAFPLRQHTKLPEVLIRNLVLLKLQAVGLRGAAELMPSELSGGMARRVALARAIVFDPMLILYDEPFVGLDPVALNQVLKLIRTLNQTLGITSVLVAHELEAIKQVADHIFLIANGKVVAQGDPATIANDGSPWTRQFFGGEADGPVPFQYPAGDYAQALGFAGAPKMNARMPPQRNVVIQSLAQIGACGLFLLTLLAAIPRSFRYVRETIRQLWFVGAMSLTIIMVCGLFVGMVLMLQLYHVLSIFGGTSASGMVVALSVYRELGPVVTALLFAGRAGTSITAEIGLMRATDQISAMEMMAVDPIAYVATPRFLAGLIAMPLLCCVFCAMAIFGGHLVGVTWLGIDNGTFWANMTAVVDVHTDIVNGVLFKSLAFGAVVSLIAVFQGFTTPPTSEGVAYATTRTVVASSIAILALDFVLTAFLM